MTPLILAVAPWAVGPSPSAHRVDPLVQIELGGTLGVGERVLPGGSLGVAVAPTHWAWFEIAGLAGASVPLCPDCQTRNLSLRTRFRVVDADAFGLAVWGAGTTSGRLIEGMAGVAVEGGTDAVRFDASTPVVSSWFLLTTLRAGPEVGILARWSPSQRTRVSVVGLEPAVAVEHRAGLGKRTTLAGSVRVGEEGARLGVSLRIDPGSNQG